LVACLGDGLAILVLLGRPLATRRRSTAATITRSVVDQIGQLVSANEILQRENGELRSEVERLTTELMEIGATLSRLSGGPRGGRGRRGTALSTLTVAEAKPKRQRKPITDPEQLERRRAALAKARAARAEKLAAARVAGGGSSGEE